MKGSSKQGKKVRSLAILGWERGKRRQPPKPLEDQRGRRVVLMKPDVRRRGL